MEKFIKSVTQYIQNAIDDKGYKYFWGEYSKTPNLLKYFTVFRPDGSIEYFVNAEYDQKNRPKLWYCYNNDKTLKYKLEFLRNQTDKPSGNIYYRADNTIFLHLKLLDGKYSETYYNQDGTIASDKIIDYDQNNDIIEFIDNEEKLIKVVKYKTIKYDEQDREIEIHSDFDKRFISREETFSEIKVFNNNGQLEYIKKIIKEFY